MLPDQMYRVEHVVMIDGAKLYAVTDMIFNGEQPIAVLIWGGKPGKEYPLVTMPLDPVHLSEHRDGQITHPGCRSTPVSLLSSLAAAKANRQRRFCFTSRVRCAMVASAAWRYQNGLVITAGRSACMRP